MKKYNKTELMGLLPSWQVSEKHLEKVFHFRDFKDAFSFMTKVALLAEKQDHHPDWSNSYNKVTIQLFTHDASAITEKDVQFASSIDSL